jgi:hypothetical protein
VRAVKGNETWAVVRAQYRGEKSMNQQTSLPSASKLARRGCWVCNPDKVLLENKNAVIYGGGGFIDGAAARTFANLTSGTFLI